MKVLVTGVAGFIGSHVALYLLARGDDVVGLDNLNDYYDIALKEARLARVRAFCDGELNESVYTDIARPAAERGCFEFVRLDLSDREGMARLFQQQQFDRVINLAAQPGVRYSLENPHAYIDANIQGFMNILEGCRQQRVEHLVYASSSSVYGANESMPFSVHDNVDHPVSLYAATKKANELMAHTYSHLYQLPTTGLRFFTVYGPWGRPDMSPFIFTRAILTGEPIKVFNYGKHRRDFTYIDDIVEGVVRSLDRVATGNENWSGAKPDPGSSRAPWRIYNIGSSQPVDILTYIETLEAALGKKSAKELLPMQPGDIAATYADVAALEQDVGYKPSMDLKEGIQRYVDWYRAYYRED
jgi:UDP-glucuronate 4-epimerase